MSPCSTILPLRATQSGQALWLGLALLVMGAATMLLMFDVGQTISAKTRLLNAADSAAYSAATWRARVFNYMAYSNRAIIAQEVAVAQAITLDSWAQYFHEVTKTIDDLADYYPPVKPYTEWIEQAASLAQQATAYAAQTEILLRDQPDYGYKALLQHSQQVMSIAANPFGASAVANEVAKASDQRIFAFALPDQQYSQFMRRYESDEDRQRLKQMTLASMDKFTSGPRGANLNLLLPTACPGRFMYLRKRGGTIMTPDLERWEAADTASIHTSSMGFFRRGCRNIEIYPMGWGAAEVSSVGQKRELLGDPGGTIDTNPDASDEAADKLAGSDSSSYEGSGIARGYELNYEQLGAASRHPLSRVTVVAQMRGKRVRLASVIPVGTGRLARSASWLADRLWAVSAAEVYFNRAPDAPKRVEYANLYSPYWQVRLAPVTEYERAQIGSRYAH